MNAYSGKAMSSVLLTSGRHHSKRKEFAARVSKFFPFSIDRSPEGAWLIGNQTGHNIFFSPL